MAAVFVLCWQIDLIQFGLPFKGTERSDCGTMAGSVGESCGVRRLCVLEWQNTKGLDPFQVSQRASGGSPLKRRFGL